MTLAKISLSYTETGGTQVPKSTAGLQPYEYAGSWVVQNPSSRQLCLGFYDQAKPSQAKLQRESYETPFLSFTFYFVEPALGSIMKDSCAPFPFLFHSKILAVILQGEVSLANSYPIDIGLMRPIGFTMFSLPISLSSWFDKM